MDPDLRSIQQARELLQKASAAQKEFANASQEKVDRIVERMAAAGARAAETLARHAVEETGFGRVESKVQKNLFATTTLLEQTRQMKTCGVISRSTDNAVWEVAVPMGVVAALTPSTNPTSTAMYKAIVAAKARCGIVVSPHPRAANCTAAALTAVAEAAYRAGAPKGLFACMSEVSLAGTAELMENALVDVILATGGTPMVKAAYSKGKPAYGVGSGNVPVYVDRSADVAKAAADIIYGVSFDWGTLCSTERSVVADRPIRQRLIEEMKRRGAHFLSAGERSQLEQFVVKGGKLNIEQVGRPPVEIAAGAGFRVDQNTTALVAEVTETGRQEPLSMETLSPILTFYTEDGWEAGCERCIAILNYGGIGHTLGLHCQARNVIEAFALEKPAMRIVVNTVAALGSVGYTTGLFPAMTLGPGTVGGSITSDNISPLHLINIKRVAFETNPVSAGHVGTDVADKPRTTGVVPTKWITEIENRLRARAGNQPQTRIAPDSERTSASRLSATKQAPSATSKAAVSDAKAETKVGLAIDETRIDELIRQFRR